MDQDCAVNFYAIEVLRINWIYDKKSKNLKKVKWPQPIGFFFLVIGRSRIFSNYIYFVVLGLISVKIKKKNKGSVRKMPKKDTFFILWALCNFMRLLENE